MKKNYQTLLKSKRVTRATLLAYILAFNAAAPVMALQKDVVGFQDFKLSPKVTEVLLQLAASAHKTRHIMPSKLQSLVERIQAQKAVSERQASAGVIAALEFIEKNLKDFDPATAMAATELLSSYGHENALRAGPSSAVLPGPSTVVTIGSEDAALSYQGIGAGLGPIENQGLGTTALGYTALGGNQGTYNTAIGQAALSSLNTLTTPGSCHDTTAIGYNALVKNATGAQNLALGSGAGKTLTKGDNNIYIGSDAGAAKESATIRIGTPYATTTGVPGYVGQTACYIAGIAGNTSIPGGLNVVINPATGQLGTGGSLILTGTTTVDWFDALGTSIFHKDLNVRGSSTLDSGAIYTDGQGNLTLNGLDALFSTTVGQNIYLPQTTTQQGIVYLGNGCEGPITFAHAYWRQQHFCRSKSW